MPTIRESGGAMVPSSSSLPMFPQGAPRVKTLGLFSLGTPELLGLSEGDRALPFYFLSLCLADLAGTMETEGGDCLSLLAGSLILCRRGLMIELRPTCSRSLY